MTNPPSPLSRSCWPFSLCIVIALISLSTHGHATFTNNLVAYWQFNDSLDDETATGANGTFVGGTPSYTAAKFGNGIDLDGNQYVEIDSVPELTFDFGVANGGSGSVTISAWFATGPWDGRAWQAIAAKGEGSDWRVARRSNQNFLAGNVGGGDVQANNAGVGDPNVNDGPANFHHVIMVAEAGVNTRMFIDGAEVANGPGGAPSLGEHDATTFMQIGGNPDVANRQWLGILDDIAIWDRALSEAEALSIYTAGDAGNSLQSFAGITTTSIEDWRIFFFNSVANASDGENNNDFNGNTFDNLLDFAFGFDPVASGPAPGPLDVSGGAIVANGPPTTNVENITNGVNFTMRYTRRADFVAAGLTYDVVFSSDLVTWETSTATPTVIGTGTGADGEAIEAVEVPYPFFLSNGRRARFARVEVTIN